MKILDDMSMTAAMLYNEFVIEIHIGAGELLRVLLACVFYSSWYDMIHSRRLRISYRWAV